MPMYEKYPRRNRGRFYLISQVQESKEVKLIVGLVPLNLKCDWLRWGYMLWLSCAGDKKLHVVIS